MRYTILTNFDNYTSDISCNNKGVITLTLTPDRIQDISLKTNIITKKRKTSFDNKYCTLYKKSGNEFLYKYTNHKPDNRNISKVERVYVHNIPSNFDSNFVGTRTQYLLKKYRFNKSEKLQRRYVDYSTKYLY